MLLSDNHARFARGLIMITGIAFLVVSRGLSTARAATLRPNILLILSDDQRSDMMSCAGHPLNG